MMREWLRERPWIWIVLLIVLLVAASVATLVIAQLNKPEVLKRSGLVAPRLSSLSGTL